MHLFVLVHGWPASGKSAVAEALATELGLALVAKDEVKEALVDVLGRPVTVAESQRLGRAAVAAQLAVARRSPGAVLDSTFLDDALPAVRALPGPLVEVHCVAPLEVVRARYRTRAAGRHPGHLDDLREESELWGSPSEPLGFCPVVEVDTTRPLDVVALAAAVRAAV
ncbi:AAA family ATPase [Solicola sp. PLA-1-18]|uniref:AAA family ATPase n=1 Tax=Solicola sp. PLA-1-18 TaxID=3380532 RepID=UPI003B821641